jgi:hypothetical protein
MQFELTADEMDVLDEILDKALRDLREEIYKAEVAEYKAALKVRERIILSVLGRVRARGAVS